MTLEDASKPDAPVHVVYMGSKKAAEEAVWKFAKEHPDFDVATGTHTSTHLPDIYLSMDLTGTHFAQ